MYKIGELSSLCRIPVKTLRFYDSEGILKPDFIDDFTGYRYYSASQLADCYMIVMLKELGFSLKEIKRFLEAEGDERLALLTEKEQQLVRTKHEVENSINVLRKFSLSLKENDTMKNIVVRKSDAFTVAYTRQIVDKESACKDILDEIRCKTGGDCLGERSVIIDYGTEFCDDRFDVGVGIELKGTLTEACGLLKKSVQFSEDTVNVICGKDDYRETLEKVNKYIAENKYQITGPRYFIIYEDETAEIKIPVAKLGEYNPKMKENIDVPFEDDPEVIGKWQMIDCVPCRENFNPGYIKATDLSKAIKNLYFLPKGEKYWCFGWTKGYLLSRCGWPEKVNKNRYWIERIDGADYLFIEFKAYDYYLGGKPELWVMKRLDNKAYTKGEIGKKDKIPVLPADDLMVMGEWNVCGLVKSPNEFLQQKPAKIPPEAWYWRKVVFAKDGVLTNTFGSISGGQFEISGAPIWRWVNGYVICNSTTTVSRYVFEVKDGKEYLFIQWKTGDYIFGNEDPYWYVFEHGDME